jgi:hypothetical protein
MATQKILIDSSFLYAVSDKSDQYHLRAVQFLRNIRRETLVVPDVILTEVTYLLKKHVNLQAVLIFLKFFISSPYVLQPLTMGDIERASRVMEKYADAQFDFVDCCIMVQAERLDIQQVCTFDRRDFSMYRPAHCEHFDLLP